jgi:hypothetical protein
MSPQQTTIVKPEKIAKTRNTKKKTSVTYCWTDARSLTGAGTATAEANEYKHAHNQSFCHL